MVCSWKNLFWSSQLRRRTGELLGGRWIFQMCHRSISLWHKWLMLLGALLHTMSQEEVAQCALGGTCCSNRFIQEGAPKSPSWEGAEQEIHLPQNFHTFLICSLETTFRVMLSSPNLPVISVSRGLDSHSGSGLSSQGLAPSLLPFWAGVGLVTNGCNQSTCLDFSTQSWFVNGVFC